jgi:hypothetical protein
MENEAELEKRETKLEKSGERKLFEDHVLDLSWRFIEWVFLVLFYSRLSSREARLVENYETELERIEAG